MSDTNYDDEISPDPAWIAILLASLWIALGAAFKLQLLGASPVAVGNDLDVFRGDPILPCLRSTVSSNSC